MAASIPTLLSVLATSATVATQVQNVQDKKKQAKRVNREAEQKSALLKTQFAQNEADRKARLKTALSTQKALFGARGISTSSGSALALATKELEDSRNKANLNQQKNALQLNQIRRGNGFSQTRAILGASNSLLNKF